MSCQQSTTQPGQGRVPTGRNDRKTQHHEKGRTPTAQEERVDPWARKNHDPGHSHALGQGRSLKLPLRRHHLRSGLAMPSWDVLGTCTGFLTTRRRPWLCPVLKSWAPALWPPHLPKPPTNKTSAPTLNCQHRRKK